MFRNITSNINLDVGLLERAGILERIRYTLKFLMINWASIHI